MNKKNYDPVSVSKSKSADLKNVHISNISYEASLRQKAEDKLSESKDKVLSENYMMKLLHELEVYQLELEMQNDELVRAKEKAELAEKKYTELYDFAPAGYLSISQKGEIVELNLAAAQMLGKERSLLIHKIFQAFVSQNTKIAFYDFLQNLFTSQEKKTCEIQLEPYENQPKFIKLEGIASQNGEQCFLTLNDISNLKEAALELTKAKEHAEESDRLKSAFLANMSHEIRTPMNGILGFASLLAEPDLTGEKQLSYISIIEKSGKRLLNIINDIIDISKIESGLMKLNITKS